MRCDKCPLAPTAEDDCCPISEGEYGLEHSDGMWGCRHSWNWCKKKYDEYCKSKEAEADYYEQLIKEFG